MTPQEVARHLILLADMSESFLGFVRALYPTFILTPFQLELIDTLDKLEKGTLGKRCLMINIPPRFGKSWLASTLFPAYYMARKPDRLILAVSYGADLATRFGRAVREVMDHPLTLQAFPDCRLNPTSRAADEWQTDTRGEYYACGVGGGTTGRPANLLLIDDPVKNRKEADSPTYREDMWSFYNSSLNNRKQPENDGTLPIEIVIQTRWHPDDLAGRIQKTGEWAADEWYHLSYPAISEEETTSLLDNPDFISIEDTPTLPPKISVTHKQEASLWPERFPLKTLQQMRARDAREFTALYQQQPYVAGGNMIRADWFQYYDPLELPDDFQSIIITCDTAFKATTRSDYSVAMTLALTHAGDIYITNLVRERLEFPELKAKLIQLNSRYRGKGLKAIYVEDKASGQSVIQELRTTPGLSVIPWKARGTDDKVQRVSSVLELIQGGRVFLPTAAPWLDVFLDEIQTFPNGTHDDQVDAMSMGLDILSKFAISHSPSDFFMGEALTDMVSRQLPQRKNSTPLSNIQHLSNFKALGEL